MNKFNISEFGLTARAIGFTMLLATLFGCAAKDASHEDDHAAEPAITKGPHGGRLLSQDDFAIELAIFESGVPPEYHAWPTLNGKAVALDQVKLVVQLTRLGGKVDQFRFSPQGDYLRGDGVVGEPHSFVVQVDAEHAAKSYSWSYENFEGRTRIAPEVAQAAGIEVETAGPATLVETLSLYGRIAADPKRQREVSARFPGTIKEVHKNVGDRVAAGDILARVESNESLQTYAIAAPIAGMVAARHANPGEQSADHVLFTLVDSSQVMAELSVFPRDRSASKTAQLSKFALQILKSKRWARCSEWMCRQGRISRWWHEWHSTMLRASYSLEAL